MDLNAFTPGLFNNRMAIQSEKMHEVTRCNQAQRL